MDYKLIRAAGNVKRYHTVSLIGEQTVASHSFNVAMLCKTIKPDASMNLIMAALTHDLAEIETGDIPATAKWRYANFARSLSEVEGIFNLTHGIDYYLTEEEHNVLKIADMLELCFFCVEQKKLGNTNLIEILHRGVEYLKKFDLNETARKLLENLMTGAK